MVQIYIRRITILKNMTLEEVPLRWREAVEMELSRLEGECENE